MQQRSGRRQRRRRPAQSKIPQLPLARVRNPFPPLRLFSDDQIEDIHQASLRILSDHGVEVGGVSARDLLAGAGADVDPATDIVRVPPVNSDTLALDTIGAVPTGGHLFGEAHTIARYETAFYQPILSDWTNFETWAENGAQTATERAIRIWKQALAEYVPPEVLPERREALEAYVASRKQGIEHYRL